ncbi:DUF2079 domain-containing protein [Kitasatospora sp. NBC_01266]|uniref:DUF2079 domain-containing protein n=1 Tax=Kitasatospora sp. NBC_01266 TaxID=2903572 RepID=UPI002E3732E4|nr:DUF2079 domain-containing protein [Kitasatospora sp. NBC_01266]
MAQLRESATPPQRTAGWRRAVRLRCPDRLFENWPHLALALAFLAGYCLLALVRYERFGSPSWDLAIFTEAVKGYAHFGAPLVSAKGPGFNALGDHWSPILLLLAPFFRLVPSAATLLVGQAALFAWSVGVVSQTSARVLHRRAQGLQIGTAYGLSWGLQRAIDAEFHEIAFAVPLLAVVGRQILLGRWERAAWWSLPLVLVKEDLGLTVAVVGVLLAWSGRRRCTGSVLVLLGLGFAALTFALLVPHFNPLHQYDYWSKLPGGVQPNLGQVFGAPFTRLTVWKTMGWLLGIVGFLALRSPLTIIALPTLAWRFASSNPAFWGPDWHYSATLMPILFLALADAVRRCREAAPPWLKHYAEAVVAAAPVIAVACLVSLPVGFGGLADPGAWPGGPHVAALRAAIARIPPGVRVESSLVTLAPLAARDDTYLIGAARQAAPQYVCLELAEHDPVAPDPAGYLAALHPGSGYAVLFSGDRVVVLRRRA